MSQRSALRANAGFAAMFAIFTVACQVNAQPSFRPIPAGSIDQAQKAAAQKVADRTLKAWRDGRFAPLSRDWTSQMKSALPASKQRQWNPLSGWAWRSHPISSLSSFRI